MTGIDWTYPFRSLLASLSDHATWASRRIAFERLVRNGVVTQGRHVYGIPRVHVYRGNPSRLRIGEFVSIAGDVDIMLGGNHPTDWVSTYPLRAKLGLAGAYADGMPSSKGDVTIGNDVWIGHGTTIVSGVRIGDGSVVAARSMVVNDLPPYSVAAGIPAKPLRKRFSDEQIDQLLEIAWWNWSDANVCSAVDLLSNPDIDQFLAKYGKTHSTVAS